MVSNYSYLGSVNLLDTLATLNTLIAISSDCVLMGFQTHIDTIPDYGHDGAIERWPPSTENAKGSAVKDRETNMVNTSQLVNITERNGSWCSLTLQVYR